MGTRPGKSITAISEDGEIKHFSSIREAARFFSVTTSTISYRLDSGTIKDGYKLMEDIQQPSKKKKKKYTPKEPDEVYIKFTCDRVTQETGFLNEEWEKDMFRESLEKAFQWGIKKNRENDKYNSVKHLIDKYNV
jgi:hypothetical protein